MNLCSLLHSSAQKFPSRTAVARGVTSSHTFSELAERATRLAGAMRGDFGLKANNHVAVITANCVEYIEILFACWHAGLVAVPVNAKLHAKEFEYILRHCEAAACFVSDSLYSTIAEIADKTSTLKHVTNIQSLRYKQLFEANSIAVENVGKDTVAWLFYTSGTTGRPKGAMLTHKNMVTMSESYFKDVDDISAGDSIIHAAPMSHGSGLYILPHVAAGAVNIVPESGSFKDSEIFELMQHWRCVTMFAAPTMIKRLTQFAEQAKPDTSNLKTMVYGGGPMYLTDLKSAQKAFGYKLAQIYGQGESPMTITAMNKSQHQALTEAGNDECLASAGKPYKGIDVAVVDEDDESLKANEVGEIIARGDTVMLGYLKQPEETAQTLKNGWLYTGDLGYFNEAGYLTLSDRSKDLIISGGSNIYPREIEEVLLLHPQVVECSVVGAPDEEWGERVVAFVVSESSCDSSDSLSNTLGELCTQHIARFKKPKQYVFVNTLPKNNYGKILKTELRKRFESKGHA